MIYIRTNAYNAEKTLERSIKSVLNQTYRDFKYYLMDHGSSDKTGEIIRYYAKQDKRIIPFYNKINKAYDENPDFWNLSQNIPKGDYFCILDADDTYEPTFFEEMLRFAEENHLEMAACGTLFFDARTGQQVGGRVLGKNIIVNDINTLDLFFPVIYWNLRQSWGKLYSSRAAAARFEGNNVPEWYPVYGGDTVNVLESLKAAGSIGVYAKSLHNYYISSKSYSYQWNPRRADADIILYQRGRIFLLETCGEISGRNQAFLYDVYYNALKDTIGTLLHAEMDIGDKLIVLNKILNNQITRQMFQADLSMFGESKEQKKSFFHEFAGWLEKQTALYTLENITALKAIYTEINPVIEGLMTEEELLWYMKEIPRLVSVLVEGDYEAAADILSRLPWDDIHELFPIVLAQTVAALREEQDAYIVYEKILIEKLIVQGHYARAAQELAEWEQLLPGDEELKVLRKRLP